MDSHYSLQFAVLHHIGVDSPHFDLFYETALGSELSALRLTEWPPTALTVFEFGSTHRRVYLTYEGSISGNRGSVRRVAAGVCRLEKTDGHTTLRFEDASLPTIRWSDTGCAPIVVTR